MEVKECYEAEDVIAIKTELIGPQADEEIIEKSTYPYIVVKIEYSDKHVDHLFERNLPLQRAKPLRPILRHIQHFERKASGHSAGADDPL